MRRTLLLGPPGTVRDLVASVLCLSGLEVALSVADGTDVADLDAEVLLLVSPGPAEWALAGSHPAGVVVVTERRPADAEALQAILAGADAIVHPDTSAEELLAAVETVRRGGSVLEPAQARLLAEAARKGSAPRTRALRLTARERSILASAERGESVKQTARSLGIAAKTVENLQSRLFRKLGARNRAHAVALAHRFGLLAA